MTDLIARYWAPGAFPSGSSTVLSAAITKAFLGQLRDTGQARVELPNGAAVLPATGGVVSFDIDDGSGPVTAFAALCRTLTRTTIGPREDIDETTVWEMPGLLGVFQRGVIGPPNGVGGSPIADTIAYNWTHPGFDDSGWTTGNAISFVQDAQSGGVNEWLIPWSAEWTEPNSLLADIVGPSDGTPTNVTSPNGPNQFHYFRQVVTVSVPGLHKMAVSCDNQCTVYVDGVAIGTFDDWQHLRFFDVLLSAGTHVVAIQLVNFPIPAGNPCGYSWALYRPGYPPPFVAKSIGADTLHVEYQAAPPGMTVGKVLELVVAEQVAAGRTWASLLTLDFTATHDSAGNLWPIEPNITATIGRDTCLALVRKLMASYADIVLGPTNWTLHAYNFGTLNPASGVVLEPERNITSLVHKTEDVIASELLIRSDGLGWSKSGSGDAQGFISLGSEIAAGDVATIGSEILAIYGNPRLEITASYAPDATQSPSELPWVNTSYKPGSIATAPGLDGSPVDERVMEVGATVSADAEELQVVITLKDRIQDVTERIIQELQG